MARGARLSAVGKPRSDVAFPKQHPQQARSAEPTREPLPEETIGLEHRAGALRNGTVRTPRAAAGPGAAPRKVSPPRLQAGSARGLAHESVGGRMGPGSTWGCLATQLGRDAPTGKPAWGLLTRVFRPRGLGSRKRHGTVRTSVPAEPGP